jgi:hypothetical protein
MQAADWAGDQSDLEEDEREVLRRFKALLNCELWCAARAAPAGTGLSEQPCCRGLRVLSSDARGVQQRDIHGATST